MSRFPQQGAASFLVKRHAPSYHIALAIRLVTAILVDLFAFSIHLPFVSDGFFLSHQTLLPPADPFLEQR